MISSTALKTTLLVILFITNLNIANATIFKCDKSLQIGEVIKQIRPIKNLDIFEQVEFKNKISRIRKWISRARKFKENEVSALTQKIHNKIETMDNYIFSGNYDVPFREWQVLFSDTENAAIALKTFEPVVDILFKLNKHDDIFAALKKEKISPSLITELQYTYKYYEMKYPNDLLEMIISNLKEEAIILGNNYNDYQAVRTHLESLAYNNTCDENCTKNANILLSKLGILSTTESYHFPAILTNIKERPSMDQIKEIAHARQLSTLTMLKQERNAEYIALVHDLGLQVLFHWLKTSKMGRKIWSIYNDQYVIREYFPKIKDIVRTNFDSTEQRYYRLKEMNATIKQPKDIILETMGRIVEEKTTKTWNDLLNFARTNDPEFATRMDAANKKGIGHDLPLSYQRSNVGRWAPAIALGGSIIYYYVKDSYSEEKKVESKTERITRIIIDQIQKNDTIDLTNISPKSLPVFKMPINDQEEQVIMKFMEDSLTFIETSSGQLKH